MSLEGSPCPQATRYLQPLHRQTYTPTRALVPPLRASSPPLLNLNSLISCIRPTCRFTLTQHVEHHQMPHTLQRAVGAMVLSHFDSLLRKYDDRLPQGPVVSLNQQAMLP